MFAVWVGFLCIIGIAIAEAGCRGTDSFGPRGEGLIEAEVEVARPLEIVVGLPFPDGITARCLESVEKNGEIELAFLMNGEDPVPAVAPDAGIFMMLPGSRPREYAIRTPEGNTIFLSRVSFSKVRDGEAVYRGQPLGDAASSEVFGVAVAIRIHPKDPRAPIMIIADDLQGGRLDAYAPEEFVCGLESGHLYASRNAMSFAHPEGTLIRERGGSKIYRIKQGSRREVLGPLDACPEMALLPLLEVGPGEIHCSSEWHPATTEEICNTMSFAQIPDGVLSRLAGIDQMFVAENGILRPFADRGTFLALGYDEDMPTWKLRDVADEVRVALARPITIQEARACRNGEPFPEDPL